jgi:hypothetical protein
VCLGTSPERVSEHSVFVAQTGGHTYTRQHVAMSWTFKHAFINSN